MKKFVIEVQTPIIHLTTLDLLDLLNKLLKESDFKVKNIKEVVGDTEIQIGR